MNLSNGWSNSSTAARVRLAATPIGASLLCLGTAAWSGAVDEVIVTATRQSQPLRDYPGSISVIDADSVELVGATHSSELVNRAAGAMTQRNNGQESLTAIRSPVLSGPGSCGVFLFLENSVPIRPVGFCNVNEMFEVNVEQAQSLEVLRGPAGVVYGSGAMHGAVNVISATPAQLPGRSFGIEAGPDEYYRARVSLRQLGGDTDFGGSAFATHDGGWRDQSGLNEQKLNLSIAHRMDTANLGLALSATHLDQETASFIQGENSYRYAALAKSNANPEAYRDAYAVRLVGSYTAQLGASTQLHVRPYMRHSRMDFLQHFLIGKPLEQNGQHSAGIVSALNFTAFDNTQLLTGLDLEYADGFLKETQAGPAIDGTPAANLIRPAGKHYDYDVRSTVAAAYGQVEQPLGDRWRLSAGTRMEYVRYQYDSHMISGNTRDDGTFCGTGACLYARPADRNDDFTNVTAKLGATYALSEQHTLYAATARGYRAPDTSELYRLQRQQTIAELDSERLDSIEIGWRGAFGQWRSSFAAFAMQKDRVIFRDANGFNIDDGRSKHRGVEYELIWSPLEALTVAGTGTYAKHAYDFNRTVEGGETIVSGRDIDTAPRHINTVRATWRFIKAARTELEWQSIGRYFLDAANAHEYGGHDLLNLRVGWQVSPNWQVLARINNVTNTAYADRADYAFGNYRYFPGRGRTLFVEARYEVR
jgi:outer membrane receptor protein involved in Fe transport